MSIDFKTAHLILPHILRSKHPVMLRGRHGIGKSEVVYSLARDLNLPVLERRVSQMQDGDLIGLPLIDGKNTDFAPPKWFRQAMTSPCLIFFDEVDRGCNEISQQIFELTDSRKFNGNHLHPDTLIVSAVNGGEHGAQYQVRDMDPAELDRWTVFDLQPSVEDWLTWGRENVSPFTCEFINQNRVHLEHTDDIEPSKVYPSRRSWKRLDDTLKASGLFQGKVDNNELFHLASGYVGTEAAFALASFFQNYERNVTAEQILDEGRIDLTKEFDINEHAGLVEKMFAKDTNFFSVPINTSEVVDQRLTNAAKYFFVLPSEVAMKLYTRFTSGDIEQTLAFHQTTVDGLSVSGHVVDLLSATAK
jgi:hypothetical protein